MVFCLGTDKEGRVALTQRAGEKQSERTLLGKQWAMHATSHMYCKDFRVYPKYPEKAMGSGGWAGAIYLAQWHDI